MSAIRLDRQHLPTMQAMSIRRLEPDHNRLAVRHHFPNRSSVELNAACYASTVYADDNRRLPRDNSDRIDLNKTKKPNYLPTWTTEVAKAAFLTTKVWTGIVFANATRCILEKRIDLHLFRKL
jgi:hypothetical protein